MSALADKLVLGHRATNKLLVIVHLADLSHNHSNGKEGKDLAVIYFICITVRIQPMQTHIVFTVLESLIF